MTDKIDPQAVTNAANSMFELRNGLADPSIPLITVQHDDATDRVRRLASATGSLARTFNTQVEVLATAAMLATIESSKHLMWRGSKPAGGWKFATQYTALEGLVEPGYEQSGPP